jgi:hypothetical protein
MPDLLPFGVVGVQVGELVLRRGDVGADAVLLAVTG